MESAVQIIRGRRLQGDGGSDNDEWVIVITLEVGTIVTESAAKPDSHPIANN